MYTVEDGEEVHVSKAIDDLKKELEKEQKRCRFWEESAKRETQRYETKLRELEEAHALIGRLTHQLSKRWDTASLTKYMVGLIKS